ncbi:MAG: DUF4105 domain-containing protein [Xanthomonadaceae bacterium]|nr:DUF4105 domain-containing protein [Xanthomonadaceae bacterium]
MVHKVINMKCLVFILVLFAPSVWSQQAWLMTYGTAERIEEQFGHNAIWIRDAARGIDQVYNFGFFDFDKPGFYKEYLFGEMVYFALARSPEDELSYYRWRDRGVRAQLLNLTPVQIRRLTDWLEAGVQPETRDFRYDYYFNNCSNRVRDGLDHALDGLLGAHSKTRPAGHNFRQHTRRLIEDDPLFYLGIQAGLGRMADRPRTLWEEMFLPEVVAETVAGLSITTADGLREPLVIEDRMLYQSTRVEPPAKPHFPALGMIALAAFSMMLIVLPRLVFQHRILRLFGARAWILFAAVAGAVLLFLWLATAHEAAWRNENLLLLNPALLLLWRFGNGPIERLAALLVAAGLVSAVLLKLLPGAQWNYDLMLWLVPAQVALLWVWYRQTRQSTRKAEGGLSQNR